MMANALNFKYLEVKNGYKVLVPHTQSLYLQFMTEISEK